MSRTQRVAIRNAFQLAGVEHGVCFQHRNAVLGSRIGLSFIARGIIDLAQAVENYGRTVLTLANTCADFIRLFEGQPAAVAVVVGHGINVKHDHVDAPVGFAGNKVARHGRAILPRTHPRWNTLFEGGDDAIRDIGINIFHEGFLEKVRPSRE